MRASQAREAVRGAAVVQADVLLDLARDAQQLAAEVRPHVRAQPGRLRVGRAARVRHRLHRPYPQGRSETSATSRVLQITHCTTLAWPPLEAVVGMLYLHCHAHSSFMHLGHAHSLCMLHSLTRVSRKC